LINDGNLKFHFVAFPEQAQFSTINDMIIADFDGDGKKDIITGGILMIPMYQLAIMMQGLRNC
jgi:hypothetical protein